MMNDQETWKVFLKKYRGLLVLLGLAIVSGTFYATYQCKQQMVDWGALGRYLESDHHKKDANGYKYLESFWGYYYKFLVIWILGEVRYLLPLALSATFFNVLAYSYVMVCIYIYYGVYGLLINMKLFVFQGVILNAMLVRLNLYQIKKYETFGEKDTSLKWRYLVEGAIGSILIASIEKLFI